MNPKKILVVMIALVIGASIISLDQVFAQLDNAMLREDSISLRGYNEQGNFNDDAQAIAVDGSGNVYVTGFSYGSGTNDDYATIKYNTNGTLAWVRRYNGSGNSTDQAKAIVVDGSGNVYVTGKSDATGTGYDYVCATIKYYPNGDTAWVRIHPYPPIYREEATALALDNSGNVYVTGQSNAGIPTIKYYPNGDTAWVRIYPGAAAMAIAVDGSGNVYVAGYAYGYPWSDYATIKYYPNGDTDWVRTYDGGAETTDIAYAIAVDGSGNVYVTGVGNGGMATADDYVTIKYLPNGNIASGWPKRYDGPGDIEDDVAKSIALDGSGNVYVTGYSWGIWWDCDYATIKYNTNGTELWVKRFDWSHAYDYAYATAVDGFGNVYVTGKGGDDYATIKYYPNGDTAWVRRYSGPVNGYDCANAIAIDGSNNVYVTGYSWAGGTYYYDYATIKYRPNGDTAWVRRYRGIKVTYPDGGDTLCVDSLVHVTWTSFGVLGNVKIELSTNSGSTWDITLADSTPNDGDHSVYMPNTPSDHCRIKITTLDGDLYDISDSDFTITGEMIIVTSPIGGEIRCVDSTYNITWHARCLSDNVNIAYSTDGGTSWLSVVSNTPNDGVHPWIIPSTPSEHCKVSICDAVDGVPCDTSAGDFTIMAGGWVKVASPNGDEILCIDSTFNITWVGRCLTDNVNIEYSTNSGLSWLPVVGNTPNDGVHPWNVPNTPSEYCRVRICDALDGIPCDTSDGDFTIRNQNIVVIAPNGGEHWGGGSQYYIRWSSVCFSGNVKIHYSINNGVSFDSLICSSCPNTGQYLWSVPCISSNYCRVRVCDAEDCIPADKSDANFTITYCVPVLTNSGIIVLLILLVSSAIWMMRRKKLITQRHA